MSLLRLFKHVRVLNDCFIDIFSAKVSNKEAKLKKPSALSKKIFIENGSTLFHGDARDALQLLPIHSIQCVITSPPYWGMRDYKVSGQIGLEKDINIYFDHLMSVFEEVWRVLKNDGVMWLNVGDAFVSGNRSYRAPDTKYPQRAMGIRPRTPIGLKPKDLIGIPWRLAFMLQDRGWHLRTEVIWNKTNCMPESVRDRPSRCHEYLFLLSKAPYYKFSKRRLKDGIKTRRTVWNIATAKATIPDHNATFPMDLILPCVESATKKGDLILDPFCGTATVGLACSKLSRHFIGVELNRKYIQSGVRRLGGRIKVLRVRKPFRTIKKEVI